MDCHGCSIVDVCKIADSVRAASIHAEVKITNCKIKAAIGGQSVVGTPLMDIPQQAPAMPPIKQYRDFRAESSAADQHNKDHDQAVAKVRILSEQDAKLPSENVHCVNCQGLTFPEDIGVCENKDCNNKICSGCSVHHEGKRLCDPCWTNA